MKAHRSELALPFLCDLGVPRAIDVLPREFAVDVELAVA